MREETRRKIDDGIAEERRASRIDYATTAFMLKKPCHNSVLHGPFMIAGRDAHKKLLDDAKQRRLYVWYATVVDGGVPRAGAIHLLDWDSVPDEPYGREPSGKTVEHTQNTTTLTCSICGKVCSSSSGYTLHMKSHDTDVDDADVDDEIITVSLNHKCPHCKKKCSSLSGLTLHIKSQHNG